VVTCLWITFNDQCSPLPAEGVGSGDHTWKGLGMNMNAIGVFLGGVGALITAVVAYLTFVHRSDTPPAQPGAEEQATATQPQGGRNTVPPPQVVRGEGVSVSPPPSMGSRRTD
jgi:hypothetical protein